ncbi:MAG: HD domain-containing phosphohydrolase [Planctomycetota bacterium]
MNEKVLIVDDDPNVLKAYERRLRRTLKVETALCSEEGIMAVNILGPFAVVVSDMMMPRENGAEFLARLIKTTPDSVRIMLTGNADQQTAAEAINKGRVFRFLNKPCDSDELEAAIRDGIEEHRRIAAERRLLSETLLGAVEMLSKVLAVANPEAFGRAVRLKKLVSSIGKELDWQETWEYETAALLSQLGYVTVPDGVLEKSAARESLSQAEADTLASHSHVAGELIAAVPKLDRVARIVAGQGANAEQGAEAAVEAQRPAAGETQPAAGGVPAAAGEASVPLGVRLLQMCRDYDALTHDDGAAPEQAVRLLRADGDAYDQACLAALERIVSGQREEVLLEVSVDQLAEGMQLVNHVETDDGSLLVAKGAEVTASMSSRLLNYAKTQVVRQPLTVLAPAAVADALGLQPVTAGA